MRLEGIGPSRTNRDGTMSTIDQNILLEQQRSRPNPRASSLVCSSCYKYTSIIRVHIFDAWSSQTFYSDSPKIHPTRKNLEKLLIKWLNHDNMNPWYGAIKWFPKPWYEPWMNKAHGSPSSRGHPPCPHVTGEILTCSISSLGCAGAIEPCQFSENLEK